MKALTRSEGSTSLSQDTRSLARAASAALERAAQGALKVAVRGALVGGSLAERRLFWVQAALGRNQLGMHDVTPQGDIGIGGVSEQLYSEGFLSAWHEILGRELGPRLPSVLYEVGFQGATWEIRQAIDHGIWVPALLKPLVGRPEMLARARSSRFFHALVRESLHIVFRMIMTEGGWGRVELIDLTGRAGFAADDAPAADGPDAVVEVANTPEPRRLGQTGRPSCYLVTGIYAAYFATVFGTPARAVETRCRAAGDARCRFEIRFSA
ncbi:MAG: 4-vinyl reductase [Polyangiaceae bacterium]|nr:4-vinyl reductase [Polyangiaceae bacterium]